MLMICNVNSIIFHVGYISVQNMKIDTICLVSYSLDCHMQSFVHAESDLGFGGEQSTCPFSASSCCFIFSLRSIYDCLKHTNCLGS